MRLAQCAWEGHWTEFEPARMILTDSTAVARQSKTRNRSKGSTWVYDQTKKYIRFQHTRVRLGHRSWEGDRATSRPVWRILADSTAVARQVPTLIFAKSGPRKTACLDLPSGPQHIQGSGKHVVEPDLAQPVHPVTMLNGSFMAKIVYTEQTYMDNCMFIFSKFALFAQNLHVGCTIPNGHFSPGKRPLGKSTLCKFGANSVQTV
jgi:hypothetical protein